MTPDTRRSRRRVFRPHSPADYESTPGLWDRGCSAFVHSVMMAVVVTFFLGRLVHHRSLGGVGLQAFPRLRVAAKLLATFLAIGAQLMPNQSIPWLEQHVSLQLLRRQVGRLRPVRVRILEGRRSEYDRVNFGPDAG